jgi:hypothetical protein
MICSRSGYYKPFFTLLAPSLTTASLPLVYLQMRGESNPKRHQVLGYYLQPAFGILPLTIHTYLQGLSLRNITTSVNLLATRSFKNKCISPCPSVAFTYVAKTCVHLRTLLD